MQKENSVDLYSLKCGISSFLATYIAGILHPLQVIKTRFQSHDGRADTDNQVPKYKGIRNALRQIYTKEGIKGLYKGFYVSLLSQALASSFFFLIYERKKLQLERQGVEKMTSVTYASIQASLIATLVTQPIWVIKTRMLLNTQPNKKQFGHMKQKAIEIYSQNGFRGFLKGISLSLILAFSGVLQMYLYQGSKIVYDMLNVPQTGFDQKNFICGGISKIAAVLLTYPLTTMRTRIQQNQYFNKRTQAKYKNISSVFLQSLKQQGIFGFYKGVLVNLAKGIPQRGIYFYFYQIFKKIAVGNQYQQQ